MSGRWLCGKKQERIPVRRGSMHKGMMQQDSLQQVIGCRKDSAGNTVSLLARLGPAMLQNLGFSPTLENCSSRIEQPAGNFWKVTLRNSDLLLPQFPPFAKHKMTESPSPCIAWMSYTASVMWLPTFICFIGSRVKTLIYFYGTHGLGDFFYY